MAFLVAVRAGHHKGVLVVATASDRHHEGHAAAVATVFANLATAAAEAAVLLQCAVGCMPDHASAHARVLPMEALGKHFCHDGREQRFHGAQLLTQLDEVVVVVVVQVMAAMLPPSLPWLPFPCHYHCCQCLLCQVMVQIAWT